MSSFFPVVHSNENENENQIKSNWIFSSRFPLNGILQTVSLSFFCPLYPSHFRPATLPLFTAKSLTPFGHRALIFLNVIYHGSSFWFRVPVPVFPIFPLSRFSRFSALQGARPQHLSYLFSSQNSICCLAWPAQIEIKAKIVNKRIEENLELTFCFQWKPTALRLNKLKVFPCLHWKKIRMFFYKFGSVMLNTNILWFKSFLTSSSINKMYNFVILYNILGL